MHGMSTVEDVPGHPPGWSTQPFPFGFRVVKPAVELVDVFICLSCDEVERRGIGQQPWLFGKVGRYDATVGNDPIP